MFLIKIMILIIWLLTLLMDRLNGEVVKGDSKKIVCYFTNWSIYRQGLGKFTTRNINPYLCTHLIYAFVTMTDDYEMTYSDKYHDIDLGGYRNFISLKSFNKDLKLLLAIGGWNEGSERWSALVSSEENRKIFIRKAVKFIKVHNFDGLDLDWEYPASRDGSSSEDKENYVKLVEELRIAFNNETLKSKGRKNFLLTMAIPAGEEYIRKGYDIPKLSKHVDFFNILSYDYHVATELHLGHHSALYPFGDDEDDNKLCVDETVNIYLSFGIAPEKLILGIPTYGRCYTISASDAVEFGAYASGPGKRGNYTKEAGFLSYYEICYNIYAEKWILNEEHIEVGPFAYNSEEWVSFDDENSVRRKAKYAAERSLSGIMFWSLDSDDFRGWCTGKQFPLIEAAKETFFKENFRIETSKLTTNALNVKEISSNIDELLLTPKPPSTPTLENGIVCTREGSFNHPYDCTKYVRCLKSNQGLIAAVLHCPSGLYFNKAIKICDFPDNVICKELPVTALSTLASRTSESPTVFTLKPYTENYFQQSRANFETTLTVSESNKKKQQYDYVIPYLKNTEKYEHAVSVLEKDQNEKARDDEFDVMLKSTFLTKTYITINRNRSRAYNSSVTTATLGENESLKTKGDVQSLTEVSLPTSSSFSKRHRYVSINRKGASLEKLDAMKSRTFGLISPDTQNQSFSQSLSSNERVSYPQNTDFNNDFTEKLLNNSELRSIVTSQRRKSRVHRQKISNRQSLEKTKERQLLSKVEQNKTENIFHQTEGKYRSSVHSKNQLARTKSTTSSFHESLEEISTRSTKLDEQGMNKELDEGNLKSNQKKKGTNTVAKLQKDGKSFSRIKFYAERTNTSILSRVGKISYTSSRKRNRTVSKLPQHALDIGNSNSSIHDDRSKVEQRPVQVQLQVKYANLSSTSEKSRSTSLKYVRKNRRKLRLSSSKAFKENKARKFCFFCILVTEIVSTTSKSTEDLLNMKASKHAEFFNSIVQTVITKILPNRPTDEKTITKMLLINTVTENQNTNINWTTRNNIMQTDLENISIPSSLKSELMYRKKNYKNFEPSPTTITTIMNTINILPKIDGFNDTYTINMINKSNIKKKFKNPERAEINQHLLKNITSNSLNSYTGNKFLDHDSTKLVNEFSNQFNNEYKCISQGLFPHPKSCKEFIFCSSYNGQSFHGWTFKCPSDLVFDPVGKICNWIEKKNICTN